jgi:hypothetical protein
MTPIGPVESWSPTLRMVVNLLLVNRLQLFLWCGSMEMSFGYGPAADKQEMVESPSHHLQEAAAHLRSPLQSPVRWHCSALDYWLWSLVSVSKDAAVTGDWEPLA